VPRASTSGALIAPDVEQYHVKEPKEASTASAQSWAVATRWLNSCLENHANCRNENRWFPTRLLSIGNRNSEIKLIITENDRPDGPYVTLSHC
jgi:hypothetical protein